MMAANVDSRDRRQGSCAEAHVFELCWRLYTRGEVDLLDAGVPVAAVEREVDNVSNDVVRKILEAVPKLETAEVPIEWDGAVDDYWYDVTPTVAVFTNDLPMMGILAIEPGTPGEIKGARATISDGTESRNGRFYIRRQQHERLVARDGVYIFAVYRASDNELLGLLATLAVIVEEELRETWYDAGPGREDYYQLSASRLPIDGLGGERHV